MIHYRSVFREGDGASILAVVLCLSVALFAFATAVPPAWAASTVGVVKIDHTPSNAEIEQMVRDAVALAGGLPILPDDHVVIKPNWVEAGWPSGGGVVTDTRVLRAVVKLCKEAEAYWPVTIAEGSAAFHGSQGTWGDREFTQKAAYDVGLDLDRDMMDDYDYGDGPNKVPIIDMNNVGTWYPDYPCGSCSYNLTYVAPVYPPDPCYPDHVPYWIPRVILRPPDGDCDVLITLPVLKNHGQAGLTVACKNRVGTAPADIYHYPGAYWGKQSLVHAKGPYATENEAVDRSIADLNMVRLNDFAVVDGLIGITDGPVGGTQKVPNMRLMMAGADSVAVDTVSSLVIGYKPTYIHYLNYLAGSPRYLGIDDTRNIDVLGSRVSQVRSDFPLPYADLPSPAARAESTPPTMTDITPADGSTVTGTVSVTPVGLSDNVGVVKVEFIIDGVVRSVDRVAPWSYSWNTSGEAGGQHTVQLIAYDAALNDVSHTHIVNVGPTTVTSPLLSAGWQLISAPIEPTDPTPTAVFRDPVGDPIPILDNLYRWDADLKRYRVYTTGDADGFGNVSVGVGMWLYLSEAKQISYSGSPAAAPVTIDLSSTGSWQLIGQPHNGPTSLTACTVTDTGIPDTKVFQDAVSAGWLYTPLYCWDVALGGYQRCGLDPWDSSGSLGAWMGYWLYVAPDRDLDLTVPRP